MGWLADILQELPVSAALKLKLEKIEAEHEKLKTELLQTKEQNAWLKAELERAKGKPDARLPEITERLLSIIANNPAYVIGNLFDAIRVSRAELDYLLDVLEQRNFIVLAVVGQRGARWSATPEGRQYLVTNKLL